MGRGADLLAEHHDRVVQVVSGNIHTHRQAGEQAAALDLHGHLGVQRVGRADLDLDLFGGIVRLADDDVLDAGGVGGGQAALRRSHHHADAFGPHEYHAPA